MTEKDKEQGRREGQVDLKLENMEKRISRIEKLIASLFASVLAGVAKLKGWI